MVTKQRAAHFLLAKQPSMSCTCTCSLAPTDPVLPPPMDEMQAADLPRGLQMGILSSCSKSFALGVLFHWSIVGVEIDGQGWRLVGVYLAAVMLLWALFASLGHMHAFEAAFRTACVANSFKLGLAASIFAYRLLFHRLRKFPGPKWAAASRFYAMYLACKNTQFSNEVEKMHKQYGDFVRIGTVSASSMADMLLTACQDLAKSPSTAPPPCASSTVRAPADRMHPSLTGLQVLRPSAKSRRGTRRSPKT
ncbi:hypothetical protein SLS54_002875 [Diplodia seriata]